MAGMTDHRAWLPQCWVCDSKPKSIGRMDCGSDKQCAARSTNAAILRAMRK